MPHQLSRYSQWERENLPPKSGCKAPLILLAITVLLVVIGALYLVYDTATKP